MVNQFCQMGYGTSCQACQNLTSHFPSECQFVSKRREEKKKKSDFIQLVESFHLLVIRPTLYTNFTPEEEEGVTVDLSFVYSAGRIRVCSAKVLIVDVVMAAMTMVVGFLSCRALLVLTRQAAIKKFIFSLSFRSAFLSPSFLL